MSQLDKPFRRLRYNCTTIILMVGFGIITIAASCLILVETSSVNHSFGENAIVAEVLKSTPLIDGHNDLAETIRLLKMNLSSFNLLNDLSNVQPWASLNTSHTDISRLRKGGVGAQFWAAYVSCDLQYKNALLATLKQIDLIKRLMVHYWQHFQFVTSADEIYKVFKEGKIAGLIGVEGGHSIDSSIAVVRLFYELGVRYLTLTHNCNTPWADCCKSNENPQFKDGLSDFGKELIIEMNRLGMLVDLSHVSFATMRTALKISKAPVIFSHSSAYSLCSNDRNVPDDVLKQVSSNGGIVMVNFYSDYVSCNGNATLQTVADHIDYIKKVAGEDHVGIGADYNGVEKFPVGLEDVSKYPFLLEELVKRGWCAHSLEKLVGKNLIRVLKQAENVRDQWAQENVRPREYIIPFSDIGAKSGGCIVDY